MSLHFIDWCIVFGLLVFLTIAAVFTKKYTQSVADFLAANRCAGRYLLSVAQGMAGVGAISLIAGFEMYYKAGFTAMWWYLITLVTTTAMFLSGWVFYRFRQTRALTLAQFLEMRYSKKFRIFSGLVAWFSGIVNFGIFPSVGARFVIYFCGLPDTLVAYALAMAALLAFALFFTFMGGQIAVIVTDFIQGTFCNIMFVIIVLVALSMFTWPEMVDALTKAPEKASLVHPFHTQETEDFNIWFYLIGAFLMFYGCGVWQGSQGYNASALNAHEARMGKTLISWRIVPLNFFMMMMPIFAYTFMHHENFADGARQANAVISGIANPQIQEQMTTVIASRFFLPAGIMGGLVAVMLAAFISTHDTYMHSWGSIFIQDVVMPFRKKPFTPRVHMLLLRISVFAVAVFTFLFSLVFRQTEYIYMFFMITGVIFTGGAGAVVIGGLYWKRGTTLGAWSAMITGSTLAVAGVVMRQINISYPEFFVSLPVIGKQMAYIASKNGAVLSFYASVTAIAVYIIVSLSAKKAPFNIDKMLHRGRYCVEEPLSAKPALPVRGFKALIGITGEFDIKDKILYFATTAWTVLWIIVFIVGTGYNFSVDVKSQSWVTFWKYYILLSVILSIVTTVWFTFGGLRDLKRMFKLLGALKRNDLDDGMVIDHHNLGEEFKEKAASESTEAT